MMGRFEFMSTAPDPLQSRNATDVPAGAVAARFVVGRDRMGRWIVNDRDGRVGGMFINEAAALRFARAECGHDPSLVCTAQEEAILELQLPSGIRAVTH